MTVPCTLGGVTQPWRLGALCVLLGLGAVACTDRVIDGSQPFGDSVEPPVDDGDPPPEDDGPPPEDDDEPPVPPEDDDVEPPPCVDEVIPPEFPVVLEGYLEPGTSRLQPSCVGVTSPEHTFSFSAPVTSTYFFDTEGSSFDTVLYALGPSCEAPELACNDDQDESLHSRIALPMSQGESVVVVLDGFGEEGAWSLRVTSAGACPEEVLASSPEVDFAGSLSGYADSVTPSCGGQGADVTFSWTPPYTGAWGFSTEGSGFDTVLGLYAADCGTELDCNDDASGSLSSFIGAELEGGVPVVIAVDTFNGRLGAFSLSISEL